MFKRMTTAAFALILAASSAHAQTNIALGGITADQSAAVEVTSDTLSVDQDSGTAIFTGNVIVIQGDLRLAAAEVEVIYTEATGKISELIATGGVTFVTPTEAAESDSAVYKLEETTLVMTGDVLLTQGPSVIAAERMVVNTDDGTAVMEGRVRTVLQQESN
ncbi:LptA/OstA family protein [Yoonia sediminilitoris]|uniref:Lipopolysaccharide export system protein LptA n=1 Tax=Yoonia sediminilitoris TaxID=1286148 RepID=A0A2T6KLM0_9RHOB|nr:LptA/OstA family protein [Yoonia sediminilitoris]PUB17110.1 lipopolysaccharide export system protein LptA [Yoonia sediminilitoris]RCW97405.1 lipopolysaccharide export system protein LptA [Yoonia sediminilitoris]